MITLRRPILFLGLSAAFTAGALLQPAVIGGFWIADRIDTRRRGTAPRRRGGFGESYWH